MNKPQTLSIKLVDTKIFQMKPTLSLFIGDWHLKYFLFGKHGRFWFDWHIGTSQWAAGDQPALVPSKYDTHGPITFLREGFGVFSENERMSTRT